MARLGDFKQITLLENFVTKRAFTLRISAALGPFKPHRRNLPAKITEHCRGALANMAAPVDHPPPPIFGMGAHYRYKCGSGAHFTPVLTDDEL